MDTAVPLPPLHGTKILPKSAINFGIRVFLTKNEVISQTPYFEKYCICFKVRRKPVRPCPMAGGDRQAYGVSCRTNKDLGINYQLTYREHCDRKNLFF